MTTKVKTLRTILWILTIQMLIFAGATRFLSLGTGTKRPDLSDEQAILRELVYSKRLFLERGHFRAELKFDPAKTRFWELSFNAWGVSVESSRPLISVEVFGKPREQWTLEIKTSYLYLWILPIASLLLLASTSRSRSGSSRDKHKLTRTTNDLAVRAPSQRDSRSRLHSFRSTLLWVLAVEMAIFSLLTLVAPIDVRQPRIEVLSDKRITNEVIRDSLQSKQLNITGGELTVRLMFNDDNVDFQPHDFDFFGFQIRSRAEPWNSLTIAGIRQNVWAVTFGIAPTVFVVLAWLPLAVLTLRGPIRTHFRRRRGLCVHCAYDLRGSTGNTCPECGHQRYDWPH